MDPSDERALRDALELAQARVTELQHAYDELVASADAQEDELYAYIETIQAIVQRESDARVEAVELVERLQAALEESREPDRPLAPGEHRQVVKLRAEVVALKHTRDQVQREVEAAHDTIKALSRELSKLKKK
ncbi:MAG: hypothetical protein JNM17_23980 [Archangium sp.]|nr:hypothetical protein [Archangium sp.]